MGSSIAMEKYHLINVHFFSSCLHHSCNPVTSSSPALFASECRPENFHLDWSSIIQLVVRTGTERTFHILPPTTYARLSIQMSMKM